MGGRGNWKIGKLGKGEVEKMDEMEKSDVELVYLNMMIPPMKVTQRAAPQAVEKQRRWAILREAESVDEYPPSDFDPNVSGEKRIPNARKATAARNRVSQAISLFPLHFSLGSTSRRRRTKRANEKVKKKTKGE